MRRYIGFVCALALCAAPAGMAWAQVVRPLPVPGSAQKAIDQLYPPSPLEQVRQQSLKQAPPLPPPTPQAEHWVPERQVFAPDLGRVVVVPGHYERRISDQLYSVPTLQVFDGTSGTPIIVPGSDRPPVDVRQGP
jgi:hypothetical protein